MDKQIEISSIKITIGKKEIELSPEDAKKLHQALNDMFGKKEIITQHEYYRYWPYWQEPIKPYYWGQVLCSQTSNAKDMSSCLSVNIL
jgi:hypothetical protein